MQFLLQHSARNVLVIAVSTSVVAFATHTLAAAPKDVETTTQGDNYGYRFKDESLLGSTLSVGGDIYSSRRGYHRVLLIRPRTDLIPQLFKSVENL